MKSSKKVKTVLLSSAAFLGGCYHEPVVTTTRYAADGTPVITEYRDGYHYSSHYHGWVPIFVPIYGFGPNVTYTSYYNSLPVATRSQYIAPRATPTSGGGGSRATPTTTTANKATPTTNTKAGPATPGGTAKAVPSGTTSGTPTTSGSVRGIAGGIGGGASASS